MFIKTITKPGRDGRTRYKYYRLCESYRIGNRIRHRTVISLGKLQEVKTDEHRKQLADRIEELLSGNSSLFASHLPEEIEKLSHEFYLKIQSKQSLKSPSATDQEDKPPVIKDFRTLDLNTIETEDVRDTGAEWLCKQVLDQLNFGNFLSGLGWTDKMIQLAQIHLISKAVYPASEHKTAQWIQDNSAVTELLGEEASKISRFQLYKVCRDLYREKESIESYLSTKTNELFDLDDKIILYDLTNTYFEGRKEGSKIARYGKSKEKRKDAKLLALALVVNQAGFVKYSKIYQGNIADHKTLGKTVDDLTQNTSFSGRKPSVIMDAGIATQDNLRMLKQKGYNYICVSRSKLKDYQASGTPIKLHDKRNNPIEIQFVNKDGEEDSFLYVKSQMKAVKENSMNDQFTQRYEEALTNIAESINKKGGTKKYEKVWERIGRLKQKYPAINRYYTIDVEQNDGLATKVTWTRKNQKQAKDAGVYFLRTNIEKPNESTIWNIYNTIREVEATFRVLKTDLSIRPVYHQKDENSEAHIFLAIIAYMIVATTRYQLKAKGINHDWQNIVRIMNSQKLVTTSALDKDEQKIYVRTCSRPSPKVQEIYSAMKFKDVPFYRKKFVLPQQRKQYL